MDKVRVLKKTAGFLSAMVVLVLVLAAAVGLVLPHLVDLEQVKKKAAAMMTERTGVAVQLDQVRLSYFPRISIVVSRVAARLSDDAALQAESLELYPAFLPLLAGDVRISKVRLQSPVIDLLVHQNRPPAKEDIDTKIAKIIGAVATAAPGIRINVRHGIVNLTADDRSTLTVHDLDSSIDVGRTSVRISASGSTDFARQVKAVAWVTMSDGVVRKAFFSVNAKEIDVIRTRGAVLPLAGNVSAIMAIFSYVRGGHIPSLSVTSEAPSAKELGNTDHIAVKGELRDGTVTVPNTALAFHGVTGKCAVVNGMLEAEHVSGSLRRTGLLEARLSVGVRRGDQPFRIDAEVKSTVGEVAAEVGRILKEPPSFLARLENINGPFEGRLVLGESTAIFRAGSNFQNGLLRVTAGMKPGFAKRIAIDLGLRNDKTGVRTAHLDAEVRDMEISAARVDLSALANEVSVLKTVFSYVPAGRVPVFTFTARGADLGDLALPEHFIIRGRLDQGSVLIPDAGLGFSVVRGAYHVEKGILHAEDMNAELENGSLRRGVLNLGLVRENRTFHFDADIDIAARTTQQLIRRYVTKPTFPLDRLRELRGSVTGRLSLGETAAALESWKDNGVFGFDGRLRLAGGPDVELSLQVTPEVLTIGKLRVQDARSNALITAKYAKRQFGGQFEGTLAGETLNRVLTMPDVQQASLSGRIHGTFDPDDPGTMSFSGNLSASSVPVPLREGPVVMIESLNLRAQPGVMTVDASRWDIGRHRLSARGTLRSGPGGLVVDADVAGALMDWATIKQLQSGQKTTDHKGAREGSGRVLTGAVRVALDAFSLGSYEVSPLRATVDIAGEGVTVSITRAVLCGISVPGRVILDKGMVDIEFKPAAKEQDLLPTTTCLSRHQSIYSGTFNLTGSVQGRVRSSDEEVVRSLNGELVFSAHDGAIDQSPRLARVLSFIDLSEIFSGSIPDVGKEQLPYHTIAVTADMKKGKLHLRDAVMDAPAFRMVATGDIDFAAKTADIKLLAAPLRTIDRVISKIPVIKQITGGSLVAVPVLVTGKFEDLQTTYMPLSSIGSGLLGLLERTIKLPVSIFEPSESTKRK